MYGRRKAASSWERDWQEHLKSCGISAGAQLEESSLGVPGFRNATSWSRSLEFGLQVGVYPVMQN